MDDPTPKIDYFSNVLLQIIFPIVLILAVIVGTTVHSLRSQRDVQTPEELEKSKLIIQKQVIVKVIENITLEKRKKFHLQMLDSIGFEFVNDTELPADTHFVQMCNKIRYDLNSKRGQNKQTELILDTVIVRVKQELREMENTGGPIHDNIDNSNLLFAKDKVEALVNKLMIDAVEYQHKYLSEQISYFEQNLDKISDEKLNELRHEYTLADDKVAALIAKEIYERLIDIIKSDLRRKRIKFLDVTWNEF